jgi:DeoR family suf operon transcriptional repressor
MSTSSETKPISDRAIIDFMRRESSCTVGELVSFVGVTATAVRQRLRRLMEQDLVIRKVERIGRGRPTHRYSLSPAGLRVGGSNFEDLAKVLWEELRSVEDPDVRRNLLKRLAVRMAEVYRDRVEGETVSEKMVSLVALMDERDLPFEVQMSESGEQLPVLKLYACPYPELAEQDRGICSLEKMLFSEILGEKMSLGVCRLDGENHCEFEMSQVR